MPTPKESKLARVLRSLSVVDLNRLEKFVTSPYFNSDERVVLLFQFEKQQIKSNRYEEDPSQIWHSIFGKNDFNEKTFRVLRSKLLSLVQEFLISEEFKQNPADEAVYLLRAIENRELEVLKNTAMTTAKRMIDRELNRSASYYHQLYQFESSAYNLNKTEVKRLNKKIGDQLNLAEIVENLDIFYIGEKLKYHCAILGWEKLITTTNESDDMSDLIQRIEEIDIDRYPHIAIYKHVYETLIDPDSDASFEKLKSLIDEYLEIFPVREAKNILDAANNYCLRKINKGDVLYLSELYNLYKKGLHTRTLLVNGSMSPWTFKNIVGVALRLREFDWAESFIAEYSPSLVPSFKESIHALSSAQLAYYRKDYNQVIYHLHHVEFKEFALKVNAEVTLIATLYELDEFEVLADTLTSFNKFLSRAKNVNTRQKALYSNLIRFVRKLLKPQSKEQLAQLRTEIDATQGLASKSWLLEKVDELIGGKKQ